MPPAWNGAWDPDDPDANFKREVAEYSRADPLDTLIGLSQRTGIPVGGLVRYILVKWTAEGSEALLAVGPRLLTRMWNVVGRAEAEGTDIARLEAYGVLREMLSWLRAPLQPDDEASDG